MQIFFLKCDKLQKINMLNGIKFDNYWKSVGKLGKLEWQSTVCCPIFEQASNTLHYLSRAKLFTENSALARLRDILGGWGPAAPWNILKRSGFPQGALNRVVQSHLDSQLIYSSCFTWAVRFVKAPLIIVCKFANTMLQPHVFGIQCHKNRSSVMLQNWNKSQLQFLE